MKNFIQDGDRILWTNATGSTVTAGSPVIVNGRAAVACVDIADGASGPLATCGVFQFAKETGKTFSQFDDVYWDAVASKVTSDKDLGSATPAAFAGNASGTGTCGTVTVGAAKSGVYRATCIAAATNAGTFEIEDPDGVIVGLATVAVAFTGGGLSFTIADGATDFSVGEGFTITVAAGNAKLGYAFVAGLSADTTLDVYVCTEVKL